MCCSACCSRCLLKEILFSCGKSSIKIASGRGITHSASSTPQQQDALQTNCGGFNFFVLFMGCFFFKVKQHFSIQTLPVVIVAAVIVTTDATQTAQHPSDPQRFKCWHLGPSLYKLSCRCKTSVLRPFPESGRLGINLCSPFPVLWQTDREE